MRKKLTAVDILIGEKGTRARAKYDIKKNLIPTETIDKKNQAILEYLGYTRSTYDHGVNGIREIWTNYAIAEGHYLGLYECEYQHSWSRLMDIVEKMEKNDDSLTISITDTYCEVEADGFAICITGKTKRSAVWLTVAELAKWYNKNKVKS